MVVLAAVVAFGSKTRAKSKAAGEGARPTRAVVVPKENRFSRRFPFLRKAKLGRNDKVIEGRARLVRQLFFGTAE